ncbi:oligosaccharide repeat unit polymerase [Peribacillus cavernae]|uniref:Oligosaccharide repeat unit polymerase n=1 Tax=Peribacillus cavernae TaxID=1674310 RepID=A0A433HE24_9BACI|nr:DUF6418 domain-containing protein [Peribacillus cavernae]MDQ0221219.1 hypothetical protein [Peribacillus cavernae]RUQ26564.1 oligosaccharide repeat unit polymerase [Peribacillus cavernae]
MVNTLNILSILIYLLFSYFIFKNNRYWPFFFFFYMAQLWALISCYYIEQGIYITEQNRMSFETGATYRLAFQNIVFFSSALIFLKFLPMGNVNLVTWDSSIQKNKVFKLLKNILFVIAILYVTDAFLTFIRYVGSYTRFNFAEYSILYNVPVVGKILAQSSLLAFFMGVTFVFFRDKKREKSQIIISLLLIIVGTILQGSAFSAIYSILVLFFIPFFSLTRIKLSKRSIKYFILSAVIIIFFVTMVFNLKVQEYSVNSTVDQAVDFTFYRIFGLQGHTWWGTDYLAQFESNMEKSQKIYNELDVILLKSDGKYTSGLNALMLLVSPSMGLGFIENGVSFTMGFPAILNIMFNPIALFFVLIICGIFFGLFIYVFYRSIQSFNLIYMGFLGYIYIYGIIQLFTMGRMSYLFNLKMYLIILLLLYIFLINKFQKKRGILQY